MPFETPPDFEEESNIVVKLSPIPESDSPIEQRVPATFDVQEVEITDAGEVEVTVTFEVDQDEDVDPAGMTRVFEDSFATLAELKSAASTSHVDETTLLGEARGVATPNAAHADSTRGNEDVTSIVVKTGPADSGENTNSLMSIRHRAEFIRDSYKIAYRDCPWVSNVDHWADKVFGKQSEWEDHVPIAATWRQRSDLLQRTMDATLSCLATVSIGQTARAPVIEPVILLIQEVASGKGSCVVVQVSVEGVVLKKAGRDSQWCPDKLGCQWAEIPVAGSSTG